MRSEEQNASIEEWTECEPEEGRHEMDEERDNEHDASDDDVDDEVDGSEDEDDEEDGAKPSEETVEQGLNRFCEQLTSSQSPFDWKDKENIWERFPKLDQSTTKGKKNILHILIQRYNSGLPEERSDKGRKAIRAAVEHISLRFPHLLEQKDSPVAEEDSSKGETPVVSALMTQKNGLIKALIYVKKPDASALNTEPEDRKAESLSRSIPIMCRNSQRDGNALHFALALSSNKGQSINADNVATLIAAAPPKAVACANSNGFSPLHYAVEYTRSSEVRLEFINKLIDKGERWSDRPVLDIQTRVGGRSAYQYFVQTRKEYWATASSKKYNQTTTSSDPTAKHESSKEGQSMRKDMTNEKGESLNLAKAMAIEKNMAIQMQKVPGKAPSSGSSGFKAEPGKSSSHEAKAGLISDRPEENPKLRDVNLRTADQGSGGNNLKEKARPKTRAKSKGVDEKPEKSPEEQRLELTHWSDKIEMTLKLHYLRTRNHEHAKALLYENSSSPTEICFETRDFGPTILAKDFIATFQHVQFDSILKYVAFRAVKVRGDGPNLPHQNGIEGRCDVNFFFQWLWEKKVERIIKVIVEDDAHDPHCDHAIEKALEKFRVEHLDWNKPDLDPNVIFRASPRLTHIVLHWGGNNTVLRGWSEPDGLRRLPKLKKVVVIRDKSLESDARERRNVEEFRARLKASPPKIEAAASGDSHISPTPQNYAASQASETFVVDGTLIKKLRAETKKTTKDTRERTIDAEFYPNSSTYLRSARSAGARTAKSGPFSRDDALETHQWLRSTKEFANQIQNVWDDVTEAYKNVKSVNAQSMPRDIVIALLDDGVDATTTDLIDSIKPGTTCDDDSDDRIRPWFASASGHGTIMAQMIRRVCPMVKILPIRLKTYSDRTIDEESAIRAIHAALDRNVDIISMSWSVAKPANGSVRTRFEKALTRAIEEEPVLMFCSATDTGHVDEESYPAGFRSNAVINVGSADSNALPSGNVGSLNRIDLLFPGENVLPPPSMNTSSGNNGDKIPSKLKGSSIATALGAGLASLVMYCAQVGHLEGQLPDDCLQRLRIRDVMIRAIQNFGQSQNSATGNKFVEIWKALDNKTEVLKNGCGNEEARSQVAALARDLVPSYK